MSDIPMENLIVIIGSALVVGLIVFLFMSFANPFLDFLIDYENVKSFNKFTMGLSSACTGGTRTVSYVKFYSTNPPTNAYAIALVGPVFSDFIKNLPTEDNVYPHTSRYSQDMIKKCSGAYCYCLLKIQLDTSVSGVLDREYDHCFNPSYISFLIDRPKYIDDEGEFDNSKWSDLVENIRVWQEDLVDELNHDYVHEIKVVGCKRVKEDLGCKYSHGETEEIPMFLSKPGDDKIVAWIDNVRLSKLGPVVAGVPFTYTYRYPLFFDSISFQRPELTDSGGNVFYSYYINLYSHPHISYVSYDASVDTKSILYSGCTAYIFG
ncbi:MAG: hypothetical protein J7K73_03750 [Nanoarchaeota archaeon]|nr:hypothetical protein [Nanoarchaeota archaeon]